MVGRFANCRNARELNLLTRRAFTREDLRAAIMAGAVERVRPNESIWEV
jgi:hypothetical protein